MFSFLRKNQGVSDALSHTGETERATPKAGYLLLLVMIIASLMFGWRALDDLANVPMRPEPLSSCAYQFLTVDWEDIGRFRNDAYYTPLFLEGPYYPRQEKPVCAFSAIEARFGVSEVYERRFAVELQLRNSELELQKIENSVIDQERQYSLGLTEKIADEQRRLYPIGEIQQALEPLRMQKADLEIRIDRLRVELRLIDDELKELYRGLLPEFRSAWRWYEFKVFLLEFVFVAPLFLFVFLMYRRLLLAGSPYTIILTALLFVASAFVLRMFLTWFWNLFLARVIQAIWTFVQNFALLKSLVFYGGMLLSIAVFGGAVYLLQKHIFDPKRVAVRSLRKRQCPACSIALEASGEFCPNCGRRIREKCVKCGDLRYTDFSVCPHCGAGK